MHSFVIAKNLHLPKNIQNFLEFEETPLCSNEAFALSRLTRYFRFHVIRTHGLFEVHDTTAISGTRDHSAGGYGGGFPVACNNPSSLSSVQSTHHRIATQPLHRALLPPSRIRYPLLIAIGRTSPSLFRGVGCFHWRVGGEPMLVGGGSLKSGWLEELARILAAPNHEPARVEN